MSPDLIVIAGPCQLENFDHALMMAGRIKAIADQLDITIIYKSSFDKANRTSGFSGRGAGIGNAKIAFQEIRTKLGLQIITDVHEAWQCAEIAPFVDILQIPAMLCRQTDLIAAAAATGLPVNIKKGQGVAPQDMVHAVGKAVMAGAREVYLTERGTTFGYGDLVVDMRSIPIMKNCNAAAVIFDCTHSVQSPGSLNGATGGNRAMSETLAMAAIAAGADGIFIETHDDPDHAPSDGAVMMPIADLGHFLNKTIALHQFMRVP